MALIKERRQFLPKSIGVIRPDTGSDFIAKGVSNLAESMIQTSFEAMKIEARKKGVETAQAASAASLRTLDPETGKPQAFNVPDNFGIEAQQAYEELIEKRYINQIELDIKEKSAQLALVHKQNPTGGSSVYEGELSDYIDSLVDGADKKFQGIVNNIGASILASTKLNLVENEINIQRENIYQSGLGDIDNSIINVQDLFALNASEADMQVAIGIVERNISNIANAYPDQYGTEQIRSDTNRLKTAVINGKAQKLVTAAIQSGASSGELLSVAEYIKAPKSQEALEAVPVELRDLAQDLAGTEGFAANRSSILGIIGEQESDANKAEVDARAVASEQERQDQEKAANTSIMITAGISDRERDAANLINQSIQQGDLQKAFDQVDKYIRDIDSDRATFLKANLSPSVLNSTINDMRRYAIEQSIVAISDGLNLQQAANFATYMERNGVVNADDVQLSPEVKSQADAILQRVSPADDLDLIQQVTNRVLTDKKPKTVTAKEQAAIDYADGKIIENNATNRDATNEILARQVGMEPSEVPAFLLTDESRPNGMPLPQVKNMMARNVPPQGLFTVLEQVASGIQVNERAYENALNHWSDHALTTKADGSVTNRLLLNGFSPQANALYQATFAIKRIQPDRPVSEIMNTLIEINQNSTKIEQNIMTAFSQGKYEKFSTARGKLNKYVSEKAQGNGQIIDTITPLIRILAGNGATFNEIDAEVDKVVDGIFAPTSGLVTDVLSPLGSRSIHALENHFPDKLARNDFIGTVSEIIQNEAPEGFIFSPSASGGLLVGKTGPYDKTKIVTLVPIVGQSAKGSNVLFMASALNERGELVPVLREEDSAPIIIPLNAANAKINRRVTAQKILAIIDGSASSVEVAKRLREAEQGQKEMDQQIMDTPAVPLDAL